MYRPFYRYQIEENNSETFQPKTLTELKAKLLEIVEREENKKREVKAIAEREARLRAEKEANNLLKQELDKQFDNIIHAIARTY